MFYQPFIGLKFLSITNFCQNVDKFIWIFSGVHSFFPDNTKILETDWANGEPSNLRGNENRIQLRKNADYRWNDADGNDRYEQVDGWSVNKYICQCKLLTASFDVKYVGLLHSTRPRSGASDWCRPRSTARRYAQRTRLVYVRELRIILC